MTNIRRYHAQNNAWKRAGAPDIPPGTGTATAPTAPLSLAETHTDTSVTASWAAPSSNGGSAITGYEASILEGATVIETQVVTGLSKTFSTLTTSTAYTVSIKAINAVGTGPAATLGVTTQASVGVTNAAMPYPTKSMRVYQKVYSSDTSLLASMPSQVNVVSISFMFGSPPTLVGGESPTTGGLATFTSQLVALRNSGVRVNLAFGGAGNPTDMSESGIVNAVNNFSTNICPVDSIDIDIETGAMPSATTLINACNTLRAGARGANIGYTMCPPGGDPVAVYLPIAAALHTQGMLHGYGQQFYDTNPQVSDADMKWRIQQAIDAGVPFSKWEMGVMNPPGGNQYWTNDEAIARINSAIAQFGDTMRGSYYWEAQRTGMADWATRISAVI